MSLSHRLTLGILVIGAQVSSTFRAHGDTFGIGADTFDIDFVTIGNPGNPNDAGAGGGIYSSAAGGVGYIYRIGALDISRDQMDKAISGGLANVTTGPWVGSLPATNITWFEAAAFANWLNVTTGHQAAYNLTFSGSWSLTLWNPAEAWQTDGQNLYRHKDAYYFLPSEDEWYKAAYHKNDGVTANYWDYATGSNTVPTAVASGTDPGTVVYNQDIALGPAGVDQAGGISPYGTRGQTGNVYEWDETASDRVNDSPTEFRGFRGGDWFHAESYLRSSTRIGIDPTSTGADVGFRVASVPEPSAVALAFCGGVILILKKPSRRTL